jgi:hypothetical protein
MHLLKTTVRIAGLVTVLAAFTSAYANPRVEQVWTCTLNDGKSIEDLNRVHGEWLEWANAQSYGGDIRGYVGASMVSADINAVVIIDSYPDMETLTADWKLYSTSEKGQALEASYDEVSTCTSNALFGMMESGQD